MYVFVCVCLYVCARVSVGVHWLKIILFVLFYLFLSFVFLLFFGKGMGIGGARYRTDNDSNCIRWTKNRTKERYAICRRKQKT